MLGTHLNNRYRLDVEIGHGGMGTIYRARDTMLGRDVAVKLLSTTGLGTEGRAHLMREARAVAQLNHPNVVTIHDVGEADGSPFIVMEWLAGQSLFDALISGAKEREGLDPEALEQIMAITRQVCAALEHAHNHGIVHRDLKPENVLLSTSPLSGARPAVKLVDFGLSQEVTSRLTEEGSLTGTVFYLAPEQAMGQPVDPRTDLYALGVMLYELLCGRLPFVGDDPLAVVSQHLYAPLLPPRAINPEVPPALDSLVCRLLSKRPEDRPLSATAVRQELEELVRAQGAPRFAELSPLEHLVRGRLVGRETELAEARSVWKEAGTESGQRRVLLITGEAGAGKTPLVRELQALANVSGGLAQVAACYAEGTAPYAPVAQFIRETLSLQALDLPELVLAGLLDLAPDLRVRFPEVPALAPLGPLAEQQRLFESVVAFCSSLVERARLLWVIEDAHWADSGTLYLLRHLAQRSRSMAPGLLLVLTYREAELGEIGPLSEVLVDLHRLGLAARIKLGRLDRDKTGDLLATILQGEVPEALLEGIYRETDGNPFFVEEICKALIEDGHLFRDGRSWRWSGLDRLRLPQSISMAIQARVSRLPAETQDVLRLAAVIGREFGFATLCRAGDLGEDAVIRALEAAQRAQLVVEMDAARGNGGQEIMAFAHKLTRTALLESLSGLRRRRLHRQVASAIQTLRPDDLEALAYHYGEAGDEEQALTYHIRAADRARRVYANDDAIRLYSEALDLMPERHPQRFGVLAARARVYDVVARREAQLADVEAMLAIADASQDEEQRCQALIALTDYYLEIEPALAQTPASKAVALAKALGDPLRKGQALLRLGREARYRYDYALSQSALEEAISHFRAADRPADTATCLHLLSLTLGAQGETDAALQAAQDALSASREAGDRRQEATSLRRLAIVHLGAQQHRMALPFAKDALALHRELGDRSEEWRALNVLGVISGWLGQLDEAGRYLTQALELAGAIGSSVGIRSATINMVWSYFRWRGEYEAALSFLEQQVSGAQQLEDEVLETHLRTQVPFLLATLGQFEAALKAVESVLPAIATLLGADNHARYMAFAGQMEAELGHADRARRRLEAALALAEGSGTDLAKASALNSLAYAALLEGSEAVLRTGLDQARRAIDILRESDAVDGLADTLHRSAQLHLALSECELPSAERASNAAAALECSSEALRLTDGRPVQPETFLYTHARALRLTGRETEVEELVRQAHERVLSVAALTRDETLRRGWLEGVRANREILRAWESMQT